MSAFSVVFFGTPEFALPALSALTSLPAANILAVVSETDKPAGRGHTLTAPPVKRWALEHGLRVLQPHSLRGVAPTSKLLPDPTDTDALSLREMLKEAQPDIGITVAYGKILPTRFLDSFRCGVINVHASLLPRWRGAAPLQRAIHAGDSESGVCIMQTEASLDTGPVFARAEVALAANETLGSLHDKLAVLGASTLRSSIEAIISGTLPAIAQPSEGVTYAEKWTTEDATLRWDESFTEIDRRIRASNPSPGARTGYQGDIFKIFAVTKAPNLSYPPASPGTIVDVQRKQIVVACGSGDYLIPSEVQLAGRKRMPIVAALQGCTFKPGDKFQ